MKLPCAVVRDLLPLYAEKMTETETRKLIDEHLEGCPDCKMKLSGIRIGSVAPIDTAGPLKALKKEIGKRRLFTALIASLCVFIAVYTYFYHETEMKPIPWDDGLIEVQGIESRPVEDIFEGNDLREQVGSTADVLVVRADSRINGFQESVFPDDDGTRAVVLQAWSSNTISPGTNRDYTEQVFYPVPDRLIYSYEDQDRLLWGEPLNGGVQVLPRLALAFYLWAAILLTFATGLLWFFLRSRDHSWILRQIFFLPVSWLIAHFLIKGLHTSSFFIGRDFISIALIALSLYAVFSMLWQVWTRREKTI